MRFMHGRVTRVRVVISLSNPNVRFRHDPLENTFHRRVFIIDTSSAGIYVAALA